jgi:hypothetical protein
LKKAQLKSEDAEGHILLLKSENQKEQLKWAQEKRDLLEKQAPIEARNLLLGKNLYALE